MGRRYHVLVVDDDKDIQKLIVTVLEQRKKPGMDIYPLLADTLERAEQLFDTYGRVIDAIVVDGNIDGPVERTFRAVLKWRNIYEGPIISVSADDSVRHKMLAYGAGHSAPKNEVAELILRLFAGEQLTGAAAIR